MNFNEILVAILASWFILFLIRVETGVLYRKYVALKKEINELFGHTDRIYKTRKITNNFS